MNVTRTLAPIASSRQSQSQKALEQTKTTTEASPPEQDQTTIDWGSVRKTAGIAGAFVAVPAALTLIAKAVDQPLLGFAGAMGGGVVAFALRPKEGSLIAGTAMSTIGFHSANNFGVLGAVGASLFGGGIGALVSYQAQQQGTGVF